MSDAKESMEMTTHDMGPSRPAALGERWNVPLLPLDHVEKMAESHWCAGWDCSTCLWINIVLHLKHELEWYANFHEGDVGTRMQRAKKALQNG